MSDGSIVDFDGDNERSWTVFQGRLGDWLEALGDQESLVLAVITATESDCGADPYVLCAGFGDGHLRGEVSSNVYLAAEYAVSDANDEVLRCLGWGAPTDGNYAVHMPRSEGARLAQMAVAALRRVFGVAHPAFLETTDAEAGRVLGLTAPAEKVPECDKERGEVVVPIPKDHEDLCALVDEALGAFLDVELMHDEDGDVPLPHGDHVVYVRVLEKDPVVAIFATIVLDVEDIDAARREAGILNRTHGITRFIVVGTTVLVKVEFPCLPFASAHLESMLRLVFLVITEVADDLLLRVGGRFPLTGLLESLDGAEDEDEAADYDYDEEDDDEGADEDFFGEEIERPERYDGREAIGPEASHDQSGARRVVDLMFERGLHGRTHIDPELIADVCDRDPGTIHGVLEIVREQEIVWTAGRRLAEEAGDTNEAARCGRWRVRWTATGEALRAALALLPPWERPLYRPLPPRPPRNETPA